MPTISGYSTAMQRLFHLPVIARYCLSLCMMLVAYIAVPAIAQEALSHIKVEGVQRIDPDTVRSYVHIKEGDAITKDALSRSLKTLYDTGLFSDIKMNADNGVLMVKVVENPVINRVAFEGNRRIDDDELSKELQLRPRSVYTRTKVQQDVDRLLDIYQKNGRFQATISPKIIRLEQNRVDLVFEITEGKLTKIQKLYFVGNEFYSDSQLEDVVRTEEERWYKFFSSDDTYDPDRLEYDKELLRRYYVENGFADFRVLSAIAELTPEADGFTVTYTVEEGDRYDFGDIAINSEIPDLPTEQLRPSLLTESGAIFNASQVELSVENLINTLGDKGYAFVDITPKMERNKTANLMDVAYNIKEGPRVYVERIDITGNVRTLDKVVRREFRLHEGDPFSTSALKRSEQRIRNLGFFDRVSVDTVPGTSPDKAVINVDVQERSTGELTLGAGFSTVDGALADIGIRENNLLGAGKQLNARLMLATERQEVDLGYTEPYFLNREISAGFDLFSIRQDFRQESSYNRRMDGGALRASYALTEHLQHTLNYTLRQDNVTDVADFASRFIRDQEGKYITSSVGHSLIYDRRDNRFDPGEGYYIRFKQDFAGLGGDAKYIRNDLKGAYYYTIIPQWVLSASGGAGYIYGLNEDVRINDRFFVGERQMRGFDRAGVGPRDINTRDALGGNIYYTSTLELMFPLGLTEDNGFRGAVFVDAGSLYDIDDDGPEVVDDNSIRMSAGVGLAWRSPLGPLRLDFGTAILKENYDETELVRFSFGTRF